MFEDVSPHLATDAFLRAALTTDPEAACRPALADAERELVERLRPLLALPADALLQHLLDGGPDGPPRWWDAPPFPAQTVP